MLARKMPPRAMDFVRSVLGPEEGLKGGRSFILSGSFLRRSFSGARRMGAKARWICLGSYLSPEYFGKGENVLVEAHTGGGMASEKGEGVKRGRRVCVRARARAGSWPTYAL